MTTAEPQPADLLKSTAVDQSVLTLTTSGGGLIGGAGTAGTANTGGAEADVSVQSSGDYDTGYDETDYDSGYDYGYDETDYDYDYDSGYDDSYYDEEAYYDSLYDWN